MILSQPYKHSHAALEQVRNLSGIFFLKKILKNVYNVELDRLFDLFHHVCGFIPSWLSQSLMYVIIIVKDK